MDDRKHLAPEALELFDSAYAWINSHPCEQEHRDKRLQDAILAHDATAVEGVDSLLTARARAILEAAEEARAECARCELVKDTVRAIPGLRWMVAGPECCEQCRVGFDLVVAIRRAYLGTETNQDPHATLTMKPAFDTDTDVDIDPVCDNSGVCWAPAGAAGVTNCVYCGKELEQREDGKWYTWDAPPGGGRPQQQEPIPSCPKCGGSKRVPCPFDGPSDTDAHDCLYEGTPLTPCPVGHIIDLHGPCTIPCPTCGAKGEGR